MWQTHGVMETIGTGEKKAILPGLEHNTQDLIMLYVHEEIVKMRKCHRRRNYRTSEHEV